MGVQAAKGAAIKISRLEDRLLKLRKMVSQHQAEMADIEAKLAAFRVVVPVLADGEEVAVYPPRAPSRPKRNSFSCGEQSRLVLKYLRDLGGLPATTVEITNWTLDAKGVTACSMAERSQYRSNVKTRLYKYAAQGLVEQLGLPVDVKTGSCGWRLAVKSATAVTDRRLSLHPAIAPTASSVVGESRV